MISFWRIFWLELTTLVRSKAVAFLTIAAAGWMLAFPQIIHGDGTAAGGRELYLHFSLGGVFALLVVTLLASATSSIAGERAAKRLQLTLVRPVGGCSLALAKIVANVAVGAWVLAVASVMVPLNAEVSGRCKHVLSPQMMSPREEAKLMYDGYMSDPNTPLRVRRAKKEAVLRILAQRAADHYQTIGTNTTVTWKFALVSGTVAEGSPLEVRMRFTNPMEMRQDVRGVFSIGGREGVVSNITQAVLTIPLSGSSALTGTAELAFANQGRSALMLRPRKDLNLLVPADAFGWNLLRTYLTLVSVLALVIAIGVFLSAGLGRPVAMFVAFVTLIVGEMSPSVLEQYPDELGANWVDRIGLQITRISAQITRPVSSLSPLSALAKDECVEWNETLRVMSTDLLLLPVLLSWLAGLIVPRKQDDLV